MTTSEVLTSGWDCSSRYRKDVSICD